MRNSLTIIIPDCRFNRKITIRRKFLFNSVSNIWNRNEDYLYLLIMWFERILTRGFTNFDNFTMLCLILELILSTKGESSIQISNQKLICFPSPKILIKPFLKRYPQSNIWFQAFEIKLVFFTLEKIQVIFKILSFDYSTEILTKGFASEVIQWTYNQNGFYIYFTLWIMPSCNIQFVR